VTKVPQLECSWSWIIRVVRCSWIW